MALKLQAKITIELDQEALTKLGLALGCKISAKGMKKLVNGILHGKPYSSKKPASPKR